MSPIRQTAPHLAGERQEPRLVDLQARQELREQLSLRLAEQPGTRPHVPVAELVLVDQHEAQGWRVRRDERLDNVFEQRCDWIREYGRAGLLAVDTDELSLTYDELDARANQLARYLRLHGAGAGDRIALLFDRSAHAYVAMLAVLKISGTYVALDAASPVDRLAHIVTDAKAKIVLTRTDVRERVARAGSLTAAGAELLSVDDAAPLIAELNEYRLTPAERGRHADQLAYIVYADDAAGRPRGVGIDHRSICNFVRVAAEVYGIRSGDRFFQGQALGSDLAVEEIWVPWAAGATLVPAAEGAVLRGQDLHRFLSQQRVTALSCTPTLLATIESDLVDLRFLLVSGEACPQSLVARWHRPGRRFINAYGPTEATFTATWTELHPDRPVTIGVPLPSYATVVLDPAAPDRALPHGATGEIGIAGIGLACAHLDRGGPVRNAFIEDFLAIPGNPSGRIYRTGDLGRVNADGELEFHGRIDRQLEIRGHRIDRTVVESALLGVPGIAAAVVETYRPDPDTVELVGYYTLRADTADLDQETIHARLREQLAAHQVPARLERLDAIPMTPRNRADRAELPAPGQRTARPILDLATLVDGPGATVLDTPDVGLGTVVGTELARLRSENAGLAEQLHQLRPHPVVAPAVAPATAAPATAVPVPVAPGPPETVSNSTPERELAALLADVVGVAQVPVDSNFFDDLGADSMVMARFCARLRKRSDLPTVSMKDVYKYPTIRGLATAFGGPATAPAAAPAAAPAPVPAPVESGLAELLAEVIGVDQVPVDSNFFDDLGADSMVMARFCARLRKRSDLPTVSIKDVYRHSTIRGLAAAFAQPAPAATPTPGAAPAPVTVPLPVAAPAPTEVAEPAGTLQYLFCGLLQLLVFVGYSYLAATVMDRGYQWISAGTGLLDIYLRSVEFGAAAFLGLCTLPIVAKWVLIGRWKPRQIRVWSLGYVRFWIVKTLVRANPLALLMVGSPLYVLYLRALGAKVGRDVVILTRHVPVCTDLLTIGAGTVVRKDAYLSCYRAHSGMIQTGRVTLGKDVFVGEKTVLDIGTSMGDGAQIGHTSSLHAGQAVPAGEHWHGSPGEPTDVDYRGVGPARVGAARKTFYTFGQLFKLVAVILPLGFGGLVMLLTGVPRLKALLDPGPVALTSPMFYIDALAISFALVFGGLVVGVLVVVTVPRLLNLAIKPDKVYRLYGFHYSLHRTIARLTNIKLFTYLFGDSSYIVGYLRGLGYDLGDVEQTGSNFGSAVMHETPFQVSVGTGTVVADGLSIGNADFSSTSFRVSRVSIGARNFLGNHIAYPAGGRTGDNCLLATKVMIPIDGKIREGVGLLGSPSFEIPRSVRRDTGLEVGSPDEQRRRLHAKNRHNLRTILIALLVRWFHVLGITLLAMAAVDVYPELGALSIAAEVVVSLLFTMVYFVLVERAGAGFRRLRPQECSIYDPIFWRHERFWKLVVPSFDKMLAGTPYKNVVSKLLGARIGRRVFDDGAAQTERTLVTIGDDCTLNEGAIIQCHSQEDGAFKSDRTALGAGVTVGVGALVHYGVTIGDGAVLAPDSFLMKGEEVPQNARWGGNPAMEIDFDAADLRVCRNTTDDLGAAPGDAPTLEIRDDRAGPPQHRRDDRAGALLGSR